MAVTTTKNLRLKMNLTDNTASTINLPAPVNDFLTLDNENVLNGKFNIMQTVFAADNGAYPRSIDVSIITTTVDKKFSGWLGQELEPSD